MSFNDFHRLTGVSANTLSERARALLRTHETPGTRRSGQPCEQERLSLLVWLLLAMPAMRLQRLADHVGMLAASPVLRQVLDGRRIATFRHHLGHELYQFGLLKAPLLGHLHAAPAAFESPEQVQAAVREAGMAALLAFSQGIEGEHQLLGARLLDRLDEMVPEGPARCVVEPPGTPLLLRVLREAEPVLARALAVEKTGAAP